MLQGDKQSGLWGKQKGEDEKVIVGVGVTQRHKLRHCHLQENEYCQLE